MNIYNKVISLLQDRFPGSIIELEEESDKFISLNPENWNEIATFLKDDPELLFDSLQCVTGVDLGVEEGFAVCYNLHSMTHNHTVEIRIPASPKKPIIPSIEQIWRIGDWFEREVFDMYGIRFKGHRNLSRILLPDDWEGWPLRKDYKMPDTYHGIVISKVKDDWE